MLRSVDAQQMLLQTPMVSKIQQQGVHGAEVEQSKLARQQLEKEEKQQRDIRESNEAERAGLGHEPQKEEKPPGERREAVASRRAETEGVESSPRRPGGFFIDLEA